MNGPPRWRDRCRGRSTISRMKRSISRPGASAWSGGGAEAVGALETGVARGSISEGLHEALAPLYETVLETRRSYQRAKFSCCGAHSSLMSPISICFALVTWSSVCFSRAVARRTPGTTRVRPRRAIPRNGVDFVEGGEPRAPGGSAPDAAVDLVAEVVLIRHAAVIAQQLGANGASPSE